MKYTVVASDFDDTLLRSDDTISEHTRKVIDEFRACGGIFLISTGRMARSARQAAQRLGLKGYVVAYQGAMVCDIETGEIVLDIRLPFEQGLEQLEILEQRGSGQIHVYVDDVLYVNEMTETTKNYERVCQVTANPIHGKLSDFIRDNGYCMSKILVIDEPEKVREAYQCLQGQFGDELYYCVSKPIFFEILKKGVSKGNGVKFVAEKFGYTMDNVIGVGDSNNDLPLIADAGLGVAVANGREELKKVADYVTLSNDEDGVAYLIQKFCLA